MFGGRQIDVDEEQLIRSMELWVQERNQYASRQVHPEGNRSHGRRYQSNVSSEEGIVDKIKAIGLKVLSVIGLLAASVFSLGLVTLIPCYFQYKKIKCLEQKLSGESAGINYKWSKVLYQRKRSDPREFKCTLDSISEYRGLNSIDEMEDLLKAVKGRSVDEVSKQFSRASTFPSLEALSHRWLVYTLVKHAGLEYACDQVTASLILNSELKVGRSEVCEIQKQDDDVVYNRFVHTDGWSPKDLKKLPNGVDPISLKYLLFRIESNPIAQKHFETLLLSEGFDEGNPRFVEAKNWLKNKGELATYVKDAAFLVDEISRSLEDRYPKTLPPRKASESKNAKELGVDFEQYLQSKDFSGDWLDKIRATAFEALKWIGIVFASALSLGLLPFGAYIYQHYRIRGLQNGSVTPKHKGAKSQYQSPKYKKKDQDPVGRPIDKKGLSEFLRSSESNSSIENISSLEPLVEGAFVYAYKDLLEFNKLKKLGVIFNRSPKINDMQRIADNWVETYVNNKNALYNWIVYQLIPKGTVRRDDKTKDYRLFFNNNLSVGFSHSCSIPFRDQNRVVDFFLNEDEWSVNGKTERSGIDPTAVYWLLQKIDNYPAAREALETLLLSALIPNDHESLRQAKQLIGENGEEAILVKCAYELISDIGRSFGSIYKNTFYMMWDELSNEKSDELPLLKEGGGVDINELGKFVEWIPALSASPEFPVYPLVQAQSVLTPIWKDIHKYRIERSVKSVDMVPVDESQALDLLSQQYYWIHVNVDDDSDADGAGCILSALCIYLYQATDDLQNMNPGGMREAFSDYLITLLNAMENKPTAIDRETYEYFRAEVEQCTKGNGYNQGWTVREYANWLLTGISPGGKKNRGHFDMGQLEIDLFCKVFRIGVQVFRGGEPYRLENGLMLPVRSYGPRTREQVILFNATGRTSEGFSFYALMPRLRSPVTFGDSDLIDPPDVQNALRHNRAFWGANHGKEWGQEIEVPIW